jgi:tRNA(His) guanylyltransferase
MNFDQLDRKMRVFETAHDHCVLPEVHMVARIDGRNFTRLTRELHPFDAPFDWRFHDYMLTTVEHLMCCGFRVVYGYTQSDEISLLLHIGEDSFDRKLRKYESILAGEASARFSLQLGAPASFDCRVCQLPNLDLVVDYFSWRQEDAHRNALNGHCYWLLRRQGRTVAEATQALHRRSIAAKNELLFQNGINYNDLPGWQRRGSAVLWETYGKPSVNPLTAERVVAQRRRLGRSLELPVRAAYRRWLADLVAAS